MNEIDKSLTDMFDAIFASYKAQPTKPRFNLRKDSSPLETAEEPDADPYAGSEWAGARECKTDKETK
jgi:hypothetical protein